MNDLSLNNKWGLEKPFQLLKAKKVKKCVFNTNNMNTYRYINDQRYIFISLARHKKTIHF